MRLANGNSTTSLVLAVVVSLVVAGTGGYMLGHRMGQPDAQVVATVNGEKITQTELYDAMVKAQGKQVLDRMITSKLVAQEAKKNNVTVTEADIKKELDEIKQSLGGEEGYKQALAMNGVTEEQLRQSIEIQVQATKILGKEINPTDEELKKFFDENIQEFDKRKWTVRHILVNTEEEAKQIKAQLDGGADFATLAKEKSIEPAAKTSGGNLGAIGWSDPYDPDFQKGAFALQKGQISNPVKTQFGYHIIQVTDVTGEAPDFAKMKDQVREKLVDQEVQGKFNEWLANLKDKADIKNTLE